MFLRSRKSHCKITLTSCFVAGVSLLLVCIYEHNLRVCTSELFAVCCLQVCLPQRSEFVFLGLWVQIVEQVLENCQHSELAFVFIQQ